MIPEVVQQNFLNPTGLTALLALIPLIIFYLVKPKPERKVMPSMTFFQEEKNEGKIKNALNRLRVNKIFFAHLLFILIAASAIANPLIQSLESEGNAVLILDVSASVNDEHRQIKEYALSNLGEKNTVITAGENAEVVVRGAEPEKARKVIKNIENSGSETDLISALQVASSYTGKIYLASDMDHTGSGNFNTVLENVLEDRNVEVSNLNHENSHGFTDLNIEGKKVRLMVKNFLNANNTVTLRKPGENIREKLAPRSTETFTFTLDSGTHKITLPNDEFPLDNTAYVSIPQKDSIIVKRLGSESRYFRKAVKLINRTEYVYGNSIGKADIYYVPKSLEITKTKKEKLEKELDKGSALIFEPNENLPGYVPVENQDRLKNSSVTINQDLTTQFSSQVYDYDTKGISLSNPKEAAVLSENSKVLFYNVEDEKFGKEITYPLFWKETFRIMTDTSTSQDLNIKTGQTIDFKEKVTKNKETYKDRTLISQTGFYRGEKTYAANFLDESESAPYQNQFENQEIVETSKEKDPARKYLAIFLALFSILELVYLSKRGAI